MGGKLVFGWLHARPSTPFHFITLRPTWWIIFKGQCCHNGYQNPAESLQEARVIETTNN